VISRALAFANFATHVAKTQVAEAEGKGGEGLAPSTFDKQLLTLRFAPPQSGDAVFCHGSSSWARSIYRRDAGVCHVFDDMRE